MPEKPALVETIVTTDMAKAIAKAYGVHLIEVLTGFKFIGEQIKWFEEQNTYHYVFGLEESYGCLAGTYARDKDACVAVMMLCEVAAYCKSQGKTLWDAMLDMYEKYGYYKEGLADLATGKTESTGLPNSNVLYYELSDGAWCCVRPSGTEPKIKFYFGVKGDSFESSKEQLQELEDALMKKFK